MEQGRSTTRHSAIAGRYRHQWSNGNKTQPCPQHMDKTMICWSPEYIVHEAHINSMIKIERNVTGAKRRRYCRTPEKAKINYGLIMDYWESTVEEHQLRPDVTQQLCNITEKGQEWCKTLQRIPTEAECDEAIIEIGLRILGRLRQKMRMSMDRTRETIEKMQAMLKWKYVLKTV